MVRGASFNNTDDRLALGNRNRNTPGNRNNNIGFRLVARIPFRGQSGAAHGPRRSQRWHGVNVKVDAVTVCPGVSRLGVARLGASRRFGAFLRGDAGLYIPAST